MSEEEWEAAWDDDVRPGDWYCERCGETHGLLVGCPMEDAEWEAREANREEEPTCPPVL